MVNYLRFNFDTLQTLSACCHMHTHYSPIVRRCHCTSIVPCIFITTSRVFLFFGLIISDNMYLDISMLTTLYCHRHHRYHRVHIH